MNIGESIILALNSIRGNKMRAALTMLGISIGVFAIMASGSLIYSLNDMMSSQLDELGENTFFIYKMPAMNFGHNWRKYAKRKPISYSQGKEFKKSMTLTNDISIYGESFGGSVKSGDLETDPDVIAVGCDENFFQFNNYKVALGRLITQEDINMNSSVAVIGNDIITKIFPNLNPIGRKIRMKNQVFTVIGTLVPRGAVMGQSQDNFIMVPVTPFLKYFTNEWTESLNIICKAESRALLTETIDEATGVMRTIRNCKPWEENNFEVETSESITEQFSSITDYLSIFGNVSGIIALIAAGVGIMNIMLVTVKERTREIGVRKAVGAKRSWILTQFIIEAVVLCQIGGLIGMTLGYGCSSLLGSMIGFKLGIPVLLILKSIGICTMLGVTFGAYPSWKAAKLDPIEALRYE
ncbi:MAG: hypothetical protein HW421_2678 [Ignavibacteria bacterium]|nr:hypothetical protein [Ignavibacteria bacterium]